MPKFVSIKESINKVRNEEELVGLIPEQSKAPSHKN